MKKIGQLTYYATGRRKESVARVYLTPGEGKISVNQKPFEGYFNRETHRLIIVQPFKATKTLGKYDIRATVSGGGIGGQAGALRHGIARALAAIDETLRVVLRKDGYLTRDPRAKERKKYGRKRARKRFQYSKR
ncbi:MAG: 30S ribosomal protein S9 [Candidatus Omnitrophica bacterium CG07_land_8_20_14_0_80_42_15]|uniref:Small ribosomal subunit protein uS9 n=1 Tax=Candidatus Aquitaenariimonas noxiae TaxID=1974741 RepID=A0A2J0KWU4_9BACT|nr:MAG: 30S ribosomal protein S9 [Candidatus Omnitrophica bacterium CG07_land_8_20_14_0_80_42_15]